MYRYEELNLKELQIDPDISLESPEALYAMAQCYRLGKGTEIDIEHYRDYLQAAMEAGSAMAKEEWEQLNNGTAAEKEPDIPEPEQEDISGSSLSELMKRLERNENAMEVHYELYRRFCQREPQEAIVHLKKASELAEQGDSLDYSLCQKIFMDMGAYYRKGSEENPEKSLMYYGRAAELGSQKANCVLAEYYKKGYGNEGEQDIEKSLFYRERALKNGTDQERYELAQEYISNGLKIKGYAVLEELLNKKDLDARLRVLCEINSHLGRTEEEIIRDAWALGDMKDGIGEYLYNYYKEKKPEEVPEEVLPTAEQAFLLGKWNQNSTGRYGRWMEWCAQNGNEQAVLCLEEERLKHIAQEEERKRKEAEQRKQEQERQKQEAERKQKEQERREQERKEQKRREKGQKRLQRRAVRRKWGKRCGIALAAMLLIVGFVKREDIGTAIFERNYVEVDPFEDLQIQVKGRSPYASIEMTYIGEDPFLQKAQYKASKTYELKDGENILIEAIVDPAVKKEYKEKLSTPGMTYTVKTEGYWVMPDTEVDAKQLQKISELAEKHFRNTLMGRDEDFISNLELEELLEEITGIENDTYLKAEFEDVQLAVAYITEGDLPDEYKNLEDDYVLVAPSQTVGWVYCVFETTGGDYKTYSYFLGEKILGRIDQPIFYVVPLCLGFEGENITDFVFDENAITGYGSLEDAEFKLYENVKPSQKLEP